MAIYVFLNGDYHQNNIQFNKNDFILAVDGGIKHVTKLAIKPDLWLGDFDSGEKYLNNYSDIKKIVFNQEKEITDLELALFYLELNLTKVNKKKLSKSLIFLKEQNKFLPKINNQENIIHILGAGGGEIDHFLTNFLVLVNYSLISIVYLDNQQVICLPNNHQINLSSIKNNIISIIPLTKLRRLQIKGVKYPVFNQDINPFFSQTIRNQITEDKASISWQKGKGLIVISCNLTNVNVTFRKL